MEIDVARKRIRTAEASILQELTRCSLELDLPIRRVDVEVLNVGRINSRASATDTVIGNVKIEVDL